MQEGPDAPPCSSIAQLLQHVRDSGKLHNTHALVEDRLLLLVQCGSRVYGTHTARSDWDLICVMRDADTPVDPALPGLCRAVVRDHGYACVDLPHAIFDDGTWNLMFIPLSVWRVLLRLHRREAVEAASLPARHVWLCADRALLRVALDTDVLRRTSSWEAKLRLQTARARAQRGDEVRARKECFHAVRYRLFATEMLQHGRVRDLGCANAWWFDVARVLPLPEVMARCKAAVMDEGAAIRALAHPLYTDPVARQRAQLAHAVQRRGCCSDEDWARAECVIARGPLTRLRCHAVVCEDDVIVVRFLVLFFDPVTDADRWLAQWVAGVVLVGGAVAACSRRAVWDAPPPHTSLVRHRWVVADGLEVMVFVGPRGQVLLSDGFDVEPTFALTWKDHLNGVRATLRDLAQPMLAQQTGASSARTLVARAHRTPVWRDWSAAGDALLDDDALGEAWQPCTGATVAWSELHRVLREERDPFTTCAVEVECSDGQRYCVWHPVYSSMMLLTPDTSVGPLNAFHALDASLCATVALLAPVCRSVVLACPEWAPHLAQVRSSVCKDIVDAMDVSLARCRAEPDAARRAAIAKSSPFKTLLLRLLPHRVDALRHLVMSPSDFRLCLKASPQDASTQVATHDRAAFAQERDDSKKTT